MIVRPLINLKPSYSTFDKGEDLSSIAAHPAEWTKNEINKWLTSLMLSLVPGQELSLTANIFEQGFDRYATSPLDERRYSLA